MAHVARVSFEEGAVIILEADEFDTDGLAIVQIIVNEGDRCIVTPIDDIAVEITVDIHKSHRDDTAKMWDIARYIIDQATE